MGTAVRTSIEPAPAEYASVVLGSIGQGNRS